MDKKYRKHIVSLEVIDVCTLHNIYTSDHISDLLSTLLMCCTADDLSSSRLRYDTIGEFNVRLKSVTSLI